MSDATTLHRPTALPRIDLTDFIDALPVTTSHAGVLAATAQFLVGKSAFAWGGRGNDYDLGPVYDDVGFVHSCVLSALNWRIGRGWSMRPSFEALADLADPMAERGAREYIPAVELLKAWGLQRRPEGQPFPVIAGDILVTQGPPCLTVVVAAATPDRPAIYAGVWPGETVTMGPYRDFSRRPPSQFWRLPESV